MPNRLADSTSLYLLQHADNPVDWWEWTDDAFAEAARRDVPALLSVGYAVCHWCHEGVAWTVVDEISRTRCSGLVLRIAQAQAVSPLDTHSGGVVYRSAGSISATVGRYAPSLP